VIENILKYFPDLSDVQIKQLAGLMDIYSKWNSKINVISRKDFDNFYIHHVLHSLSVAKFTEFAAGTRILDAGTGGGFPGIPLAIVFPDCRFFLLDSIEKKIRVVSSVAKESGLMNVTAVRKRIEEEEDLFDFVVSRAVAGFQELVRLIKKNIDPVSRNKIANGIISLKGGDLAEELASFYSKPVVFDINEFFPESYFKTKKIVYMPL
jgi:16S rRNA (guanine527-N7)-methyltransferase